MLTPPLLPLQPSMVPDAMPEIIKLSDSAPAAKVAPLVRCLAAWGQMETVLSLAGFWWARATGNESQQIKRSRHAKTTEHKNLLKLVRVWMEGGGGHKACPCSKITHVCVIFFNNTGGKDKEQASSGCASDQLLCGLLPEAAETRSYQVLNISSLCLSVSLYPSPNLSPHPTPKGHCP